MFRLVKMAVTPLLFKEVDLAGQHGGHVGAVADPGQVGDGVGDHHRRVEVTDECLHGRKVGLEAEQARSHTMELE